MRTKKNTQRKFVHCVSCGRNHFGLWEGQPCNECQHMHSLIGNNIGDNPPPEEGMNERVKNFHKRIDAGLSLFD